MTWKQDMSDMDDLMDTERRKLAPGAFLLLRLLVAGIAIFVLGVALQLW